MTMDSINEILDAIIRGSLLGFLAGFWLMGLPFLTADSDVVTDLKSHFLEPLTFENDGRCCLVVISALFVNLHASNLLIFHKLVSFSNQMLFFENLT